MNFPRLYFNLTKKNQNQFSNQITFFLFQWKLPIFFFQLGGIFFQNILQVYIFLIRNDQLFNCLFSSSILPLSQFGTIFRINFVLLSPRPSPKPRFYIFFSNFNQYSVSFLIYTPLYVIISFRILIWRQYSMLVFTICSFPSPFQHLHSTFSIRYTQIGCKSFQYSKYNNFRLWHPISISYSDNQYYTITN